MSAKPQSNSPASEVVSVVETPSAPNSVEQIRDILFGQKIQEYELRFSNLEKKLANENNTLKNRVEEQLRSLESELTKRTESAIAQERQARLSELKGVQHDAYQGLQKVEDHLQEQTKEVFVQLEQREDSLAGIFLEISNKLLNRKD